MTLRQYRRKLKHARKNTSSPISKWMKLRIFCLLVPIFSWSIFLFTDEQLRDYDHVLSTSTSRSVLLNLLSMSILVISGMFFATLSQVENSAYVFILLLIMIVVLTVLSVDKFRTGSILLAPFGLSLLFLHATLFTHGFLALLSILRIQLYLRDAYEV